MTVLRNVALWTAFSVCLLGTAWADSDLPSAAPGLEQVFERPAPGAEPLWEAIAAAEPMRNRAGGLRFVGVAFEDPGAVLPIAHRLVAAEDEEAVRLALVRALPMTGGPFDALAVQLLRSEERAPVRAALCAALRRGGAHSAREGLLLGLADPSSEVREEAARSLGWRGDGGDLAGSTQALMHALGDSAEGVRAMASRSLGWLEVAAAIDGLRAVLDDSSPEVRLHALRSMGRIEPGAASFRGALSRLQVNSDPRVARVARRLAGTP